MKRRKICIVDYGVGNHSSVAQMISKLGHSSRVTKDPIEIKSSDLLILPGVGAFPIAMNNIIQDGTDKILFDEAKKGKKIIGICLGMQLLAEQSHEFEKTNGLGMISGVVRPMSFIDCHIGWNRVDFKGQKTKLKLKDDNSVYFNHSYVFETSPDYILAESVVNGRTFTSAVKKDNIYGLQFHPEKSQYIGMKIFQHLIEELNNA